MGAGSPPRGPAENTPSPLALGGGGGLVIGPRSLPALTIPPPVTTVISASSPTTAVLPAPSRLAPRHTASRSSSNRLGDGLHALVVDDDTLTRKLMSRMLTRLGVDVSVAENGQSALDAIGKGAFDVVFLDK